MDDFTPSPPLTPANAKLGGLARTLAVIGLDFHVASTLLFRGWTIVAGAGTMVVLPLCLSPTQQGYYYTFGSILALQVFFELGLNQIVVQLVSHEVAHLSFDGGGALVGSALHLDRLGSLARLMFRWYAVAAALFMAAAGIAGALFFANKSALPLSAWSGAWGLLVAMTAVNLFLSPGLAMMEGAGSVGQVARLRLIQSLVGYACLWLALSLGAGLWAATTAPLAAAVCTMVWLRTRGTLLQRLGARTTDPDRRLSWRRDVLPLQWRIALSWASGYFIFNLFTPLVFLHQGAVEAGRLGLAMTIFNAISTVGMSWISASTPQLTTRIALGDRRGLNALFFAVAKRSVFATAALSAAVLCAAMALEAAGVAGVRRISPLPVLACLAWVATVNAVIFSAATFMRAHRQEPLLAVSILGGVLTAAAAWVGSRMSVGTMMLLYAAVTTFVGLPWTLALFSRYLKRSD